MVGPGDRGAPSSRGAPHRPRPEAARGAGCAEGLGRARIGGGLGAARAVGDLDSRDGDLAAGGRRGAAGAVAASGGSRRSRCRRSGSRISRGRSRSSGRLPQADWRSSWGRETGRALAPQGPQATSDALRLGAQLELDQPGGLGLRLGVGVGVVDSRDRPRQGHTIHLRRTLGSVVVEQLLHPFLGWQAVDGPELMSMAEYPGMHEGGYRPRVLPGSRRLVLYLAVSSAEIEAPRAPSP